jgi:hypothetical protein
MGLSVMNMLGLSSSIHLVASIVFNKLLGTDPRKHFLLLSRMRVYWPVT